MILTGENRSTGREKLLVTFVQHKGNGEKSGDRIVPSWKQTGTQEPQPRHGAYVCVS
jgi:hypothetical protein